ncbi:MAG: hypothetical protein M1834_002019 [Cirrosporium novae-zelandiae]|nr:MAG: hypothetical protein M1834_002019 [Cirrosporium novae-zelandiae]
MLQFEDSSSWLYQIGQQSLRTYELLRDQVVNMRLREAIPAVIAGSTQLGVVTPLVEPCLSSSISILCINQYASVMPYHFFRPSRNRTGWSSTFGSSYISNDPLFSQVDNADFLVFDRQRGFELLGTSPSYEYIFEVPKNVHEAPVYVSTQNKLYISRLTPGYLPQLVLDLNEDPPTISEYLSDPPVYAPNGGTIHNGLIYWGASGGINSIGGTEQRPGVRVLDLATNKSVELLNNYFGYFFNCIDDLVVHPNGDIWFTDPNYSWYNKLSDVPPQLAAATYRFRPSTGAVSIVEDTLAEPNGIAFSPDSKILYISDTGAVSGLVTGKVSQGQSYSHLGKKTVYAFDVSDDATYLTNKRPIYLAQQHCPDGLKVARNGYVLTATGMGVDILDSTGTLLVRVQTNYTVQNFAWAGNDFKEFWMMGEGGISRVRWELQGQELK